MAYEKQHWIDGESPLNAERMNHMEDGIGQLSEEIEALKKEEPVIEEVTQSGAVVAITAESGTEFEVTQRFEVADGVPELHLHHIGSSNIHDFVNRFGGAGTVIEKNGMTATINADGTVTMSGVNTSSAMVHLLESKDVAPYATYYYPAGTYYCPGALRLRLRGLPVQGNNDLQPELGNKGGLFEVSEPFRIQTVYLPVNAGATPPQSVSLWLVAGGVVPSTNDYVGHVYTANFTSLQTKGTINWNSGEMRDDDGNLLESFTPVDVTAFDGLNRIFGPFGEVDVTYNVETSAGSGIAGAGTSFDYRNCGVAVLDLGGDATGMTKDVAKDLTFVWGDRIGNVNVKLQGSSSVQTGKDIGAQFDKELGGLFNFTLKFEEAFEAKEGWGEQKKYCFKANAIDHSHARNLMSCKLWGESVKSRAIVPTELSTLPNGGAVDGFPIIVTLNGKFYAAGTFNIPKDGWMFGSPKAILCADKHVAATQFNGLANLTEDFELEYVEDENNADWVLPSLNRAIQAVMNSDGSNLEATVGQYIDLQSAMDYYIHAVAENATDATDKNYIMVTFDGVKWYFSNYDRDTTYGLEWTGKDFVSPVGGVTYAAYANTHRLMGLIYANKKSELKARSTALFDGVLSEANVATVFTNFAASIPAELLAQNGRRWPLLRSTNASNTAQILNWYRLRRQVIDKEIGGWTV